MAEVRATFDLLLANLTAENARVRQRAEKAEDERDRLQARLDTATAHVEELRGQRDEARWQRDASNAIRRNLGQELTRLEDEVTAMHPVVEAAEAWRSRRAPDWLEYSAHELPVDRALVAAVDAWRAAQPDPTAPTDRPSATEPQDQGADDGTGTEGSQAQGGAQGPVEYRDPDAHWPDIGPNDPALMVCNKCGGQVWTGDDGWACNCDGAMFEYADPANAEPAPADPAGLDAAIEAAQESFGSTGFEPDVKRIEAAVRAAAPPLRAAALNEAADELPQPKPGDDDLVILAVEAIRTWLRERAGRIGGGE